MPTIALDVRVLSPIVESSLLWQTIGPPEIRSSIPGNMFTPFTERTLTTPKALLAELERVAEQGWAQDRAEHEPFMNCVAAPIRDATGRVVAAASLSVPDLVLPYEQVLELLPQLRAACAAISADCGAS